MPIRQIFWAGSTGRDIHLVRGDTSRDLTTTGLAVVEVMPTGADRGVLARPYLTAHPEVQIEFRPLFRAQNRGTTWEGLGIVVDKTTGVVSFLPGAVPVPTRSNFLIECVATRNDAGPSPPPGAPAPIAPALITRALIRVHVHPGVRRIWMTPNGMTVRRLTAAGQDKTNSRFTVRAEFTDDVVGDVTLNHNVAYAPVGNVAADGLLTIQASDAVGAAIPITATWRGQTDTKTMTVGRPWEAEPTPPKVDLVDGRPDAWDGTINPERVPNVLIFGDGFADVDLPAFETIANKLVHDLKVEPLTRPYDRLATSMNFWRVVVSDASRPRGISVRCEVSTSVDAGTTVALPLPPALPPPPAPGAWTVSNLIYVAGLPIPADNAKVVSAERNDLRDEWALTLRAEPTDPPLNVTDAIIADWKALHTRTFIDEIDGFPGMALGTPPEAGIVLDPPLLELHPDRGGDRAILPFYRILRARNNVALSTAPGTDQLGNVWAEDRAGFDFDSRSLVVAFAGVKGGRAQRLAAVASVDAAPGVAAVQGRVGHIAVSIEGGRHPIPVMAIAGRRAVSLAINQPIQNTVSPAVWHTIAHEMGHSFGLGDEYVNLPGSYTAPETSVDQWGNLTTVGAVSTGPGGALRAQSIKWNWHRVRKAAVLTAAPTPTPTGGNHQLTLANAGGHQFAVGDRVFLRQRRLRQVIGRVLPIGGPPPTSGRAADQRAADDRRAPRRQREQRPGQRRARRASGDLRQGQRPLYSGPRSGRAGDILQSGGAEGGEVHRRQ